jgi:hypothetical protein
MQYLTSSNLSAVNFQHNGVSKPYSTASGLFDAFGHKLEYERKVVKDAVRVVAHDYTHTGEWWGVLSVRKQSVFTCLQT